MMITEDHSIPFPPYLLVCRHRHRRKRKGCRGGSALRPVCVALLPWLSALRPFRLVDENEQEVTPMQCSQSICKFGHHRHQRFRQFPIRKEEVILEVRLSLPPSRLSALSLLVSRARAMRRRGSERDRNWPFSWIQSSGGGAAAAATSRGRKTFTTSLSSSSFPSYNDLTNRPTDRPTDRPKATNNQRVAIMEFLSVDRLMGIWARPRARK